MAMPEPHRMQTHWALENLIKASVHCVDTRDYLAFGALFALDGRLYRPTSPEPIVGPEAIAKAYAQTPPNRFNRHLVTNVLITNLTADRATVQSYVLLFSTEDAAAVAQPFGAPVARALVGEFADQCMLTPDGWRLHERRAAFTLNMNPMPATGVA
ncbi:nuclear transport factor 2 family protein [Salinispirillum marinum]|uniref:Nuclear transport factor 2 family protein n=2 Tax=Saccharospirillaceae TaxID=255527 RepID=A0ABV8BCQ8_9GAMM